MKKKILIIAGEASGDLHGAELMQAIKTKDHDIEFFGMGGDRMIAKGLHAVRHVKEMAFLGFLEVVRHYPFIRRVFHEMVALLESNRPDLVVLIDYPGFNLRFAEKAHRTGIPVCYYISPQIWAWGGKRIHKIKKYIDHMIVIFPFEETMYRQAGVPVTFVGHPLKDTFKVEITKDHLFKQNQLNGEYPLLGLLPGSRKQEVKRLLPEMVRTYQKLKTSIPDLQCIIGAAPTLEDSFLHPHLQGDQSIPVVRETHALMQYSDTVLVASGTATLETALAGTPMVVLYKMMPFSYYLGKYLVKIDHIGLVNIVAGKRIVPELIQRKANAADIAEAVHPMIVDTTLQTSIKNDLKQVAEKLGKSGASDRTAEVVLKMLYL